MQKCTHLTEQERYHIYLMRKQGFLIRFIAKTIKHSPSTISREIKRNTAKKGYRYSRHKKKNKHIKLSSEVKYYIN